MKTKILIVTAVISGFMAFTSCGERKEEKREKPEATAQTKFNEEVKAAQKADSIEIAASDSTLKATKNGEDFTGDLWSLDGKSFVMHFKNGKPTGSTTYHKNGKVAIEAKMGNKASELYYDENGKTLSDSLFLIKYEKYLDEIGPQLESVFARMNI